MSDVWLCRKLIEGQAPASSLLKINFNHNNLIETESHGFNS